MKLKLGTLATPLIALALLVLAANAWVSYDNTLGLVAKENLVQHAQAVLLEVEWVVGDVSNAAAAQRGYLLTGGGEYLTTYNAAKARSADRVRRLNELEAEEPQQSGGVAKLVRAVDDVFKTLDAGIQLRTAGPIALAQLPAALREGGQTLDEIRTVADDLRTRERRTLTERDADAKGNYRRALWTLGTATVVAMGMVGLAYGLMRRDESARRRAGEALRDSDERARMLLESTGEGIYGIDADGDVTFVNNACATILGYDSAKELLGRPSHELFHHTRPDGTPYPKDELPHLPGVPVGPARPGGRRGVLAEGQDERPGRVPVVPDRAGGEARRGSGHVRGRHPPPAGRAADAAPRERAPGDRPGRVHHRPGPERRADHVRERGVRATDRLRVAGGAGAEDRLLRRPGHRRHALADLRGALDAGRAHAAEVLLYRKDETTFWGTVSLAPVTDAADRVTHFVGVVTDVTERRRAEEELKRAKDAADATKEAAEAANVAKSQFLANMSHELRTPLNAVIMYSELLQEEAEDRKVDGFIPDLEKIRTAGKHLLALVNGVLDLSKIEAGKMDLYLETFDVSQMVKDVAATVQPLVQKRSNQLVVNCQADAGSMHADLTKVRQILFNLLSNAAKFTERGTITVDVTREERRRAARTPAAGTSAATRSCSASPTPASG
jgi:signal transduction histidine kinase/CHASE3 domain sensor protein